MPSPREEEEVEWPEDRAARPHSSPISPYVTLDKVLLCRTFISRSRQGGLLFVSDLDERPYSTYGGKKKNKLRKAMQLREARHKSLIASQWEQTIYS